MTSFPHCLKFVFALTFLIGLLGSCADQDDEFFPYKMKGFNSWVYEADGETSFLAGYSEASYNSRHEGLASCAALAATAASARHLDDWTYVCCTVTDESQCATKVR